MFGRVLPLVLLRFVVSYRSRKDLDTGGRNKTSINDLFQISKVSKEGGTRKLRGRGDKDGCSVWPFYRELKASVCLGAPV